MTGMDSARLSARKRQPGHDRSFVASESIFIEAARSVLDEARYVVEEQPRELRAIFGDGLGVQPEAVIISRATNRRFFIEVKKQGPQGNAEERAYKHHTVQFHRLLQSTYRYDYHPFVTVFCESLAVLPRYTVKIAHLIEPDHYLLWADYDRSLLEDYLNERCAAWLD